MKSSVRTPDWNALTEEATRLLAEYVRLDTTNPPGNEALACDWLAAWGTRRSAERVVSDAEISIGWMHSGYPIKCYLDSAKDSVNVRKLRTEGN